MRHAANRLHLRVLVLLILLLPVTRAAGALADDGPPAGSVLRIPLNDSITPGHLGRMTDRSATARDLVARLERVPTRS